MITNDGFFSAIYRHSPIGLVILDENAGVVDANDYMFRIFRIDRSGYQGLQFGNLFNCTNVAGSQVVCGHGERCGFCHIRAAITQVLADGLAVEEMELSSSHRIGGADTPKWFKLAAGPAADNGRTFAIVSFTDVTKEKQYEALLRQELTIDGATGALNKQSLIGLLQDLPGLADSFERVSVGIVDMDDFKKINDNYGHLTGDRVLESFTRIARECVRRQDIVGRFGGEEFMLVFPGVGIDGAESIVRRIYRSLSREFEEIPGGISFSAGFVELDKRGIAETTKETIIDQVDQLMYGAKAAGKRRFAAPDRLVELG